MIPLVALGPPEESTALAREKLPEYNREEELPIRGIANSLILDLRRLYRDDATAELDRTIYTVCQRLLESGDTREQIQGLRFWAMIRAEHARMLKLELQHAKVGIEAVLAVRLARLQLKGARSEPGATPEQVSQQVAEVLRELAAGAGGG